VHLVGFIIKTFVSMHGHTNVKFLSKLHIPVKSKPTCDLADITYIVHRCKNLHVSANHIAITWLYTE